MVAWNYARTWTVLAQEVPDRVALVCGERRVTYQALEARADLLARCLAAHGVTTGDTVAVSLSNRPEYLETFFAALKLGAVPVNLNYHYVVDELAHVIRDCDARAIVCHVDAVRRCEARSRRSVETASSSPSTATTRMPSRGGRLPLAAHDLEDDARLLLYTGGTTGRPKGVVWRVEDYYLQSWEAARPGTTPPDPVVSARAGKRAATLLPASPLVHATALSMATGALNGGGTVVLHDAPRLDPVALWRLVARERVAVMSIVGETFARPLLRALDDEPGVAALDLSSFARHRVLRDGVQRREQAGLPRAVPRG